MYPFTVEYSLSCLAIFFIIWKNIGERKKEFGYILKTNEMESKFTVDCNKTNRGLFFGIILILVTIVANIMFIVYKPSSQKQLSNNFYNTSSLTEPAFESNIDTALVIEILEFLLISFSAFFTVLALNRTRKLQLIEISSIEFDELLLIVSLCGIYIFSSFGALSIIFNKKKYSRGYLSLMTSVLATIEGTLQTYLIFDCLKRRAVDPKDRKEKPGRELLTILIVINLCLWISDTFSFETFELNSYQMDYYSVLTWSIIYTISSPLAIFFRFHASVCLSACWKAVYL